MPDRPVARRARPAPGSPSDSTVGGGAGGARPELDREVHESRRIVLPAEGLRIAAVADTHSRPHPDLSTRLREIAPSHILHAGDVGDSTVLRALERHAPVIAVRGNIDERGLPDRVTVTIASADGETPLLRILLTHIAVNGTKLRGDVLAKARAEGASLVVCGHSHVPFAAHDRGVTVFNPGSAGPRRFHLPILLGVLDVRRDGIAVGHVDCATGLPWRP